MADFTQAAQQFQRVLGRAPTQDEIAYFSKFIDAGELDINEIGQALQAHPEAQRRQLEADTSKFSGTLNAQNADILNQAGAAAQSRFAGLGRPNTSALGASVMQAGGQLAQQRQSALANFYGQGLQNNAALMGQQGAAAQARGYGLRDETRRRNWQIEDYYRQKNDYQDEKNASSGWNAITPEFAVGSLFNGISQAASAYVGGKAGRPKPEVD